MVKVRINKISFFFSVIKMLACNGLSFKERHSRDVPPTPGSSQRLLRLLQEAAVLRYINADNIQACGITRLTSKLMQLAYLRRVCHRHSRRLWKDLSTCCCCWRVIVFAYCFNIISLFIFFLSLFKQSDTCFGWTESLWMCFVNVMRLTVVPVSGTSRQLPPLKLPLHTGTWSVWTCC